MNSNLTDQLKKAVDAFKAMTPEQQAEHYRIQRDNYVKAEMSWPKPKFKMINGVKVYDSMEDYYND